jgi:S-adenosylmethionine/arginine decarboxylase-like enzyme
MMFWGKLGTINLYECNPEKISNKKNIREFVKKLTKEINMKPYGACKVKRFGEGDLEGYSAIQFIETSSITLHFDEIEDRAFIDIFSCKDFDVSKAEKFSKEFFEAKKSNSRTIVRE